MSDRKLLWVNCTPKKRRELIAQVYRPGDTAKSIAEKISEIVGDTVTRNAIIGQYSRHKKLASDFPLTQGLPRKKPSAKKKAEAAYVAPVSAIVNFVEPLTVEPKGEPKAKRKSSAPQPDDSKLGFTEIEADEYDDSAPVLHILDERRTDRHCRWPLRDGGYWCGRMVGPEGGSYCPHHAKRARTSLRQPIP